MSYNYLSSDYTGEDGVNPHFKCQKCGFTWQPHFKPVDPLPNPYTFNASYTVICPNCSNTTSLYFAVYNDAAGTAICISRNVIAADWWRKRRGQ